MPLLAGIDLTTTGQTLIYQGAGQERTINVRACNRSGAPVTVTIWAVPTGQSPGNPYVIEPATPIPPGGVLEDLGIPFEIGARIMAQAGAANSINVMVWGL